MQNPSVTDKAEVKLDTSTDQANHGIVSAVQEVYKPGMTTSASRADSSVNESALFFSNIFSAIDSDKNGSLSKTEFQTFANAFDTVLKQLQPKDGGQPPPPPVEHPINTYKDIPANGEDPAKMTADGRDKFPQLPTTLDKMEKNLPVLKVNGNDQAERELSKIGKVTKNADGSIVFDAQGKQIPPLSLANVHDLTIKNAIFANTDNSQTSEAGVYMISSKNVAVQNSRFENVGHGVQAQSSTDVHIDGNYFGDMKGAQAKASWYRSDPIQLNDCHGTGSISKNIMNNGPQSCVEDNINLGSCTFTQKKDGSAGMVIQDNYITGASDSWHVTGHQPKDVTVNPTGTGIQLEGGVSGVSIQGNEIHRQNNGGISVWSGSHVLVKDNLVDMSKSSLGGDAWAKWGACAFGVATNSSDITFEGNTAIMPPKGTKAPNGGFVSQAFGKRSTVGHVTTVNNSWQHA